MNENEIEVPQENVLATFSQADYGIVVDKSLDGLSGDFLPRIMVMQALSKPVTDDKIKVGQFGLVGSDKANPQDIGDVFDAFVIAARPKAMYIENEAIIEDVYDIADPVFTRIRQDAETKVQGEANMYGAEFLLYLLKEQKFAVFFYGNATLRREIGTTKGMVGKTVTFMKNKITAKGKTWYGLKTAACTTPYEASPTREQLLDEVKKFQTPTPKKREAAPAAPAGGRAR